MHSNIKQFHTKIEHKNILMFLCPTIFVYAIVLRCVSDILFSFFVQWHYFEFELGSYLILCCLEFFFE